MLIAPVGLRSDARTQGASGGKQCSVAISHIQKSWTKVEKATCESVGEKFKRTIHTNGDMCDDMQSKTPNMAQKSTSATGQSTTTYTKV